MHIYIKEITYANGITTIELRTRKIEMLSYLYQIEGVKHSKEQRVWRVPLKGLIGLYKFLVRWNTPLPKALTVDVQKRAANGKNLPFLLNISNNRFRSSICKKLNLTILDDLRYQGISANIWRREGRYAIANPDQRQTVLNYEKEKLDTRRIKTDSWLETAPDNELMCHAFNRVIHEIIRIQDIQERAECRAASNMDDDMDDNTQSASLATHQAESAQQFKQDLRSLHDEAIKVFIKNTGAVKLKSLKDEINEYQLDQNHFYQFTGHNYDSDQLDDLLSMAERIRSANLKVSKQRAIILLIGYLCHTKNIDMTSLDSTQGYREILKEFLNEKSKLMAPVQ